MQSNSNEIDYNLNSNPRPPLQLHLHAPLQYLQYLIITRITVWPLLIIHRPSPQNDFKGRHQNCPIMQSNLNEIDESDEARFIATSSKHIFNRTPYPPSWQSKVGSNIVRAHKKDDFVSFLLVRPTGSGKTFVFNTLALT